MPPFAFALPVCISSDVVVVGGGPAGIAAALSAARSGASVTLIEQHGFLGGSATAAQVPAFAPFSDRTKAIVRGIGWEILTEMTHRMGRPIPNPNRYEVPQEKGRMDWAPIDVELLKVLYDELCATAGIRVLLHTFAPEVIKQDERLTGIVLANKSGLSQAQAAVFIDATGDADIAARMGCPFVQGDDTGATQGMTLCFTVAQGSRTNYLDYVYQTGDGFLAKLVEAARQKGDYHLPDASLVSLNFRTETIAGANMGHVYGFDGTNASSLSQAERDGRSVVQQLIPFLRKYVPGQEDLILVGTGVQIGVRETRRIVGDYVLTLEDYLSCRDFEDGVARNAYFLDLHAVTSAQAARVKSITDLNREREERRPMVLHAGQSHGIPYRSLLPQRCENLLVAGRSLSAERIVQGAARVMPVCFAMGEAAGIAAALSLAAKGVVRSVNVGLLQHRLRENGAWL